MGAAMLHKDRASIGFENGEIAREQGAQHRQGTLVAAVGDRFHRPDLLTEASAAQRRKACGKRWWLLAGMTGGRAQPQ